MKNKESLTIYAEKAIHILGRKSDWPYVPLQGNTLMPKVVRARPSTF